METVNLTVQPIPATTTSEDRIQGNRELVQRKLRRHRVIINGLRLLVLIVFLGGWELFTGLTTHNAVTGRDNPVIDPFFYGRPSGIVHQLYVWVTTGTAQGPLLEQIGTTMEEAVLGFMIGVVFGIILGVALGRVRILAEIFGPYISIANSFPRVVLGSIFVISLGLGLWSKVALAVVLVFFVVFYNAFQGVREVDRNLIANARILGASPWQVSTQVIMPSALTWIIASMHTSFGFAIVGAVVGEYLGAQKGIGLMITTAQGTFNPNGVFASMVILAVVALSAEAIVTFIERKLLVWRPTRGEIEIN